MTAPHHTFPQLRKGPAPGDRLSDTGQCYWKDMYIRCENARGVLFVLSDVPLYDTPPGVCRGGFFVDGNSDQPSLPPGARTGTGACLYD